MHRGAAGNSVAAKRVPADVQSHLLSGGNILAYLPVRQLGATHVHRGAPLEDDVDHLHVPGGTETEEETATILVRAAECDVAPKVRVKAYAERQCTSVGTADARDCHYKLARVKALPRHCSMFSVFPSWSHAPQARAVAELDDEAMEQGAARASHTPRRGGRLAQEDDRGTSRRDVRAGSIRRT